MNSIEFDGFHVSEYTSPMDPMMGIPSYGLNLRQHVESEQAVFDKSKKVSDNSGVMKLPKFGRIKQYKCMVILREFPYTNALFGLVICAMVKSRYIGDDHPTFNRNPYNGYINPYYYLLLG